MKDNIVQALYRKPRSHTTRRTSHLHIVSCLLSSHPSISRHWNPPGQYTRVHYASFSVETFSWGISMRWLALIMCMCVCVCVHLTSNEPMFATGHVKWCVTLVTAGYDGIFSLWVTGPTRHSLSGLFIFFLPFVCVCVMYHVCLYECAWLPCVCTLLCVWRVKKWACQKWMIRLIRWNTADSRIKTHWREKTQI